MNIFIFFLRTSYFPVILATLFGAASGICSALLIAMINNVLNHPALLNQQMAVNFFGLLLLTTITGIISQHVLIKLSQQAIYSLRLRLSERILASPLIQLEQLGPNRLMATLTEDIHTISATVLLIPFLCIDVAIIIGALFYLGQLSWLVLLLSIVCLLGATMAIRFLFTKAESVFILAREEQDRLFTNLEMLTDGIKELKLNYHRRQAFLQEELRDSAKSWRDYNILSMTIIGISSNIAQLVFFSMMGGLIFGLPHLLSIDNSIVSAYILVLTYLLGPLKQVTGILPELGRASVALQKIDSLGLSLINNAEPKFAIARAHPLEFKHKLELRQIIHSYRHELQDRPFTVGPIDLTIAAGEVIFIIGGNGSGKSTLAKLITGLYLPESGGIYIDNVEIDGQQLENYRQLFSTVFSDFYLFKRLLGIESEQLSDRANKYLHSLQLEDKVQIDGDRLSTLDLSQGQRKRLALLTAYLEDRSIYLFDEWAADQDPGFKDLFYTQIVPELKRRGKTVLAITHDDRYFSFADRLIKLDYGQLT